MASAAHARLIQVKLTLLEEQKSHLKELLNDVNKVLRDGKAWVERRQESELSSSEISKRLEDMTVLLIDKTEETSTGGEGTIAMSSSEDQSFAVEGVQTSQPTEMMKESQDDIQKILSRLDVVEIAVSSLRSTTEKTAENQIKVDAQMEEVSKKQNDMEEEQTKLLTDLDKKMKKLSKKSDEVKQHEKRIVCLEKEGEVMKQQEKRVVSLEAEVKTIKKQDEKIVGLEKQVEKMASEHDDLKSRLESLSNKTEATDNAVQDLSGRVDKNKSLLDAISIRGDEDHRRIDDLDLKTKNISKRTNKNQKKMEEKLEEVKTEYKMVCHIVANRLLPLERLRNILNQKVKNRDENLKKLEDVTDKVASLSKDVTDIEQRLSRRVGFTAYKPCQQVPDKGQVIKDFTNVKYNTGNHFDPTIGIFTVPVSGLYVVSCTLFQLTEGMVDVAVRLKKAKSNDIKYVCLASARVKNTNATGFAIVEMESGDTLCMEVVTKEESVQLTNYSSFSCALIG